MPTPLVNPAPVYNFMITLWDEAGPLDADPATVGLLSAAVNFGAQWLMGAFSEVQGLDAELEIETYQEGGRNNSPRRFAKVARYQNLTLKRGVTFNPDLWDWHQQVINGNGTVLRKGGMITLFDRGGPADTGFGLLGADRIPVASWTFTGGLPERLRGPQLNAKSNEIAIESFEISHQGLSRVSLGSIPGVADAAAALGGIASVGVGLTGLAGL